MLGSRVESGALNPAFLTPERFTAFFRFLDQIAAFSRFFMLFSPPFLGFSKGSTVENVFSCANSKNTPFLPYYVKLAHPASLRAEYMHPRRS